MINNLTLMGRLTYEPELKTTPSGVSVLRFQVASDRAYQSKGEERKADFIDCVAWRQTAEFVHNYFHKGDMIALTGSVQTNNYTDKNGDKKKSVDVMVNSVDFCGSKKTQQAANADVDFEEIGDDDDLPF